MTANVGWRHGRIRIAIAILATAYLALLCYRNAKVFHEFGSGWMGKELARRPLLVSALAVIALGTILIPLFRKSSLVAMTIGLVILMVTLGLEGRGLFVRTRAERVTRSMTALRDLGNVVGALRKDKDEFPESLPESLRASAVARDGWGREMVYLRVTADEAYLSSLGADGRQDVEVHQGMASGPEIPKGGVVASKFPPSDVDHDIVYELSVNGYSGFIIYPEGISSGERCRLLSALGCFAY